MDRVVIGKLYHPKPVIPIILALTHICLQHFLNGPVRPLCLPVGLGMKSRRHCQYSAHHLANLSLKVASEFCILVGHYHLGQIM